MGNMRFKVGDRVRIKSLDWYNKNKTSEGCLVCGSSHINPEMIYMLGKIATISSVEGNHYRIKEYGWNWTDEMIEGLVEEETKPKFKIGDKVILDPYPCVVTDVTWRDSLHGFVYTVRGTDFGKMVGEEDLVLDERTVPNTNEIIQLIKNDWNNFKDRYDIPDDYHFVDKNGNEINISEIVLEKKKKEYPKTYEECLTVLEYDDRDTYCIFHTGADERLFEALYRLKVCRDAYWKLYGEEMGLGKPWSPDLTDNVTKHCIEFRDCGVCKVTYSYTSRIFAFPTEEMRDAFYENFKELIESCKELL